MAGSELLYFFVVYGTVMVFYAFVGMVLYGRSVSSFSTFGGAFNTLFLMQIGEATNRELEAVFNGSEDSSLLVVSNFYYYSFMALIFFILANMLLGILIDAFVTVQETSKKKIRRGWLAEDLNLGVATSNVREMLTELRRGWHFSGMQLLACARLVPKPDRSQLLWTEEQWLRVVDQIANVKSHNLWLLRSSKFVSLLAAIKELPSCKDDDIFLQAKARFMSDDAASGFGLVWPLSLDADGTPGQISPPNQALTITKLMITNQARLDERLYSLEVANSETNKMLDSMLSLLQQSPQSPQRPERCSWALRQDAATPPEEHGRGGGAQHDAPPGTRGQTAPAQGQPLHVDAQPEPAAGAPTAIDRAHLSPTAIDRARQSRLRARSEDNVLTSAVTRAQEEAVQRALWQDAATPPTEHDRGGGAQHDAPPVEVAVAPPSSELYARSRGIVLQSLPGLSGRM